MQLFTKSLLILACFNFQSGFCCPSSPSEKDSNEEQTTKTTKSTETSTNKKLTTEAEPCMFF